MRFSMIYQGAAIALMVFQSYFAAVYLGLDDFGAQMLAISPIFFAQSVVEPSLQAEANAGASGRRVLLNAYSIALSLGLGILVWLLGMLFIREGISIPVLILAVVYLLYTALTSVQFAIGSVNIAALSSLAMLVFYMAGFFLSDMIGGGNQIVFGNIFGFFAAAMISGTVIVRTRAVQIHGGPLRVERMAGGLTFRLPLIMLTGVSTMILGRLGAPTAMIGEFRVFMSAINAGRYFNPVPIAQAQQAIHRWAKGTHEKSDRRVLLAYIVGLGVFALSFVLLFSPVFDLFFGHSSLGVLDLLLATSMLVLQPVSYAHLALRAESDFKSSLVFICLAMLIAVVFYMSNVYGYGPFLGVGVSATLVVSILALQVGFLVGKRI